MSVLRPKILYRKERKKIKKSAKNRRLFGDVSSTGHTTCTRTEWITRTISLDLIRVLLLERTHERVKNERMNERMNETAFDSIVCSFFLSLFAKARENVRAKVDRISHHHHHHHPTWKTPSIGISLSPKRAREFKRERYARKTRRTRTTPPLLTEL